MKNLLIFLFGATIGAGGTLLWLRKDIKKELADIKNRETEEPFTMENDSNNAENKTEANANSTPVMAHEVKPNMRTDYHAIVETHTNPNENEDEYEPEIIGKDDTDGAIYEISSDEFMHNHDYAKKRLVYFQGDRIMSTEAGTIIANPFMLVGGEWELCVDNYADRTAFIRNERLREDYEIYVEAGNFADEFGIEDNYRED